jgi:hypothetical protein
MKESYFLILLIIFLQFPAHGTDYWGRHGGGSGVYPNLPVGQEKGDAVYRKLMLEILFINPDDFHAAVFAGFDYAEPKAGVSARPFIRVIEKSVISPVTPTEEKTDYTTIDGIAFVSNHLVHGQSGGVYLLHGMEEVLIYPEYPENGIPEHTVANMDALSKAFRWGWGENEGAIYKGAFSTSDNFNEPWHSNIDATKRTQITSEAQRVFDYGSQPHQLGYCITDMVEPFFDYVYYDFIDIGDVEQCRCDFVPEWSYEHKGILVWHGEESSENTGSGDKYVGNGLSSAAFHNNAQSNNDCYNPTEVSPQVQSGDFYTTSYWACPYAAHDSRSHTKMRPSEVEKPVIEFLGRIGTHLMLQVSDNASENIYFSILVYQNGNTLPPGNFLAYAKDETGQDYKYRKLFLSQSFISNGKTYRRQSYLFNINDNLFTQNDRVLLVVTDEGCNSSDAVFGGPIGDGYNSNNIGLIFRKNGFANAHADPYGNLLVKGDYVSSDGVGLKFNFNNTIQCDFQDNGNIHILRKFVYFNGTLPDNSFIIKAPNQIKKLAISPDGSIYSSGGIFTGADLSGY